MSVVPITVCLPAAPLQPAVCAAHDTTVIVASSLVTGNVVDGGDALEGARVELELASGGELAPMLRRALTDRGGSYTLVDAPAGNYHLVFSTAVEGGGWEERARIEVTVTAEGREEVATVDVAS